MTTGNCVAPFVGVAAVTLRWIINGGAGGRMDLPRMTPSERKTTPARIGCNQCSLRNCGAHFWQNFRLVQTCQRSRIILLPQAAQKLGRESVRS